LANTLVDVQQGRIGRRREKTSSQRWLWRAGIFLAGCIVLVAAGAGLLRLLVNEATTPSAVESAGEPTVDVEPGSPLSPLEQLQVRDPSPLLQSDAELDALSDMLDELESTPFPESAFQRPFAPTPGADGPNSKTEATAPGEEDAAGSRASSAMRWRFNFRGAPWKEVLEWFSTIADRPLWADEFPKGTFNYVDRKPYSLQEIANLLDTVLRTKGFLLKLGPSGVHVIRLKRDRAEKGFGAQLPGHDELVADRRSLLELKEEITNLEARRDSLPHDAADRAAELAILQTQSESLHNQIAAALGALKAKSEEAEFVLDQTTALLARVDSVNRVSAECVPQHVVMELKQIQIEAKAAFDEINAVLGLGASGLAPRVRSQSQ
jgi:hypothetical protein